MRRAAGSIPDLAASPPEPLCALDSGAGGRALEAEVGLVGFEDGMAQTRRPDNGQVGPHDKGAPSTAVRATLHGPA